MKKQITSSKIKNAAREEVRVINESPRYIMRQANKLATGRDAKECGVSMDALKELYGRVCTVFGDSGIWWDSVVTDGRGGLVTSMRPIKQGEYIDSSRVMQWHGTTYVIRVARWSLANIVASAALRLKQAEDLALAFDAPYAWMIKRKKAAKKATKKATKKAAVPDNTMKALQELRARLLSGKITKAESAALLGSVLTA